MVANCWKQPFYFLPHPTYITLTSLPYPNYLTLTFLLHPNYLTLTWMVAYCRKQPFYFLRHPTYLILTSLPYPNYLNLSFLLFFKLEMKASSVVLQKINRSGELRQSPLPESQNSAILTDIPVQRLAVVVKVLLLPMGAFHLASTLVIHFYWFFTNTTLRPLV